MSELRPYFDDGVPRLLGEVLTRATATSERSGKALDPRLLSGLMSCSHRLQIVATDLAERLPPEDESVVLDRATEELVREFLAIVREFEVAMRMLDLAAIEIFNPDLAVRLRNLTGLDDRFAVSLIYEVMASPYDRLPTRSGLETVPELLASLHRMEYLGGSMIESCVEDSGSAKAAMPADVIAVLRDLAASLTTVKDEIARFVRDNWSPRDLAPIDRSAELRINVAAGGQMIVGNDNKAAAGRSVFLDESYHNESGDPRLDPDTLNALGELAELVRAHGGKGPAELLTSFRDELAAEEPKRSKLAAMWQGLTSALGPMSQLTDIGARLAGLM